TGPLRSPVGRGLRGKDQHPAIAVVRVRAPTRRTGWRLSGRFQTNRPELTTHSGCTSASRADRDRPLVAAVTCHSRAQKNGVWNDRSQEFVVEIRTRTNRTFAEGKGKSNPVFPAAALYGWSACCAVYRADRRATCDAW